MINIYLIRDFHFQALAMFHQHNLFERSVELIYDKENFKFISNSLQGTKLLSLTANLIQLFCMESTEKAVELAYPMFTVSFN